MSRVLAIVSLSGLLMVTGVAFASPVDDTRIPVSFHPDEEGSGEPRSVVVEKGDHLWKISARQLDSNAGDGEVAPYWRQVVEVNTPRLRSGNPDLIFPGEVVLLPAIP